MQHQVILLDAGGVLVELSGEDAMLAMLPERVTLAELWRMWLGSTTVRAFERGLIDADTFARELIIELRLDTEPRAFLEAFTSWPKQLYPGALELLARIPRGYQRALLSNTNALHWPRKLDQLGLRHALDAHFASHLIGKIKPDRDAFQHLVDALGCRAEHVLFLDDNVINVQAAVAFGMQARLVRGVREAEQALVDAGVITPAHAG
jgi:putative hydrolase of the HAD superfamily